MRDKIDNNSLSPDEKLINKFLEKRLTTEELVDFNHRIKTDRSFANNVKSSVEMIATLKAQSKIQAINDETNQQLNEKLDKLASNHGSTKYGLLKWIIVIALVFLFIASLFLIYRNTINTQDSPTAIYNDFIDRMPLSISRSNDKTVNAFKIAYLERQDDIGVAQYEEIASDSLKRQFSIYAGIMYLYTEEIEKASNIFQSIINAPQSFEDNEALFFAQWYLALALIKQNKINEALQQLEELANNNPKVIKRGEIPEIISKLQIHLSNNIE